MRIDARGGVPAFFKVTLSRRNLLALLAKLEIPGSHCAIDSENAFLDGAPLEGVVFRVISEPDEVHYRDRPPPGPMHPLTEQVMKIVGRLETNGNGGAPPGSRPARKPNGDSD